MGTPEAICFNKDISSFGFLSLQIEKASCSVGLGNWNMATALSKINPTDSVIPIRTDLIHTFCAIRIKQRAGLQ